MRRAEEKNLTLRRKGFDLASLRLCVRVERGRHVHVKQHLREFSQAIEHLT